MERMGGVIDKNTGLAAEQFNDNINRLETSLSSLGVIVAKEVTKPLADLSDTLADPKTQEGLAKLATGIVTVGKVAVESLAGLANFTSRLGEEFAAMVNGISTDDINRLEGKLYDLQEKVKLYYGADYKNNDNYKNSPLKAELENAEKLVQQYYKLHDLSKNVSAPASKPTVDTWAAEADAAFEADLMEKRLADKKAREAAYKSFQDEQKKLNELVLREADSMKERLALTSESTELERIRYRELHGDLQNATLEQKAKLEGLASELDLQKQLKDLADWSNEQYKEKAALEESLMTDVERVNKLWDDRIAKIKTLGYDEATAAELIAKAEKGRKEDLEDKAKKGADNLSEYSKQAARNMQSSFADFLFDPFDKGLDGLVDSFAKAVQRMVAEWAAAQIFNGIGDWGKANAGAGGTLGSIAGLIGGMFAEGGRPPMGKISVVGDGGEPELFVPDTAGTIVPFSKLGGGGDTFHFGNMVFPGVTNAREAELAAGAAGRQLLGMLNKSRRYS